ncbi:YoaK family protein [Ensifer sp. BR816]|uniref:YoaK family protein n=1 Tax=Rhizobium sp. (strain BR816) TaxID=1057002 RepID=UPI000476BCD9|nr:YoaK family protein [Ensifer sp. BR816]
MTVQRRRRIIKRQRSSVGLALVAGISFLAGMTDAIGLMSLGDFVSFMSGNTTRASVSLVQGDVARGVLLIVGLIAFVIGNAAGVMVSIRFRPQAVLLLVSVLLACAALLGDQRELRFLLLIFAMGAINASVEQIEGLPVGLTYVTGALSRFGRGLGRWAMGIRNTHWVIQIVPWLGMMAGAISGAVFVQQMGSLALWLPSVAALVLTGVAVQIPRRWQSRFIQQR